MIRGLTFLLVPETSRLALRQIDNYILSGRMISQITFKLSHKVVLVQFARPFLRVSTELSLAGHCRA
jgi:hypothetical protein